MLKRNLLIALCSVVLLSGSLHAVWGRGRGCNSCPKSCALVEKAPCAPVCKNTSSYNCPEKPCCTYMVKREAQPCKQCHVETTCEYICPEGTVQEEVSSTEVRDTANAPVRSSYRSKSIRRNENGGRVNNRTEVYSDEKSY